MAAADVLRSVEIRCWKSKKRTEQYIFTVRRTNICSLLPVYIFFHHTCHCSDWCPPRPQNWEVPEPFQECESVCWRPAIGELGGSQNMWCFFYFFIFIFFLHFIDGRIFLSLPDISWRWKNLWKPLHRVLKSWTFISCTVVLHYFLGGGKWKSTKIQPLLYYDHLIWYGQGVGLFLIFGLHLALKKNTFMLNVFTLMNRTMVQFEPSIVPVVWGTFHTCNSGSYQTQKSEGPNQTRQVWKRP